MGKKIFKVIIILVIIILFIGTSYIIYTRLKETTGSGKKVTVVDNISNYDYSLKSNSTKYMKSLFDELKDILQKNPVVEEDYAKKVAQLFVTDLFTLSNKLTSSDIGGIQFVYKSYQDDFISIAQSGMYSSIQSNVYGDRKQELPEVIEVTISKTNKNSFKYNKQTLSDAYYIDMDIKYKKDLGYPSKYQVVVAKNDKTMEVVKASNLK